jgi:anti-sigma B factor antagonist
VNNVEFYEENGICIIKPAGEMIFFFLEEASMFVKDKIRANFYRFVFELSHVTWIDSIGLGLFALAIKAALLNQKKICVIKPKENIVQLFKISNLLELIKICGSMKEAVDYLYQ